MDTHQYWHTKRRSIAITVAPAHLLQGRGFCTPAHTCIFRGPLGLWGEEHSNSNKTCGNSCSPLGRSRSAGWWTAKEAESSLVGQALSSDPPKMPSFSTLLLRIGLPPTPQVPLTSTHTQMLPLPALWGGQGSSPGRKVPRGANGRTVESRPASGATPSHTSCPHLPRAQQAGLPQQRPAQLCLPVDRKQAWSLLRSPGLRDPESQCPLEAKLEDSCPWIWACKGKP